MANNIIADVSLNIRELMDYSGLKTFSEFAKLLGISDDLLSKWRKRNTYDIDKIVEAFPDVSVTWLLTREGSMLRPEASEQLQVIDAPTIPMVEGQMVAYDDETYQRAKELHGDDLVPEYSAEFRGGEKGALLDSSYLVAHWVIPNAPRGAFIITMVGESMMPSIPSGAKLLLAPYSFDPAYPVSKNGVAIRCVANVCIFSMGYIASILQI